MVLIIKRKTNTATLPSAGALAGFRKFKLAVKAKQVPTWEPWNLWRHNVHASALSLFCCCKRQFELVYRDGWQKPQTNEALEFGTCFHQILEKSFRLKKSPTDAQIKTWVAEYEAEYIEEKRFGISERDFQTLLGWVEALAPVYFRQWLRDYEHPWNGTEIKWQYPFRFRDGRICQMGGTIDRLQEVSRLLWGVDTKTRSQINVADEVAMMPLNLQFNLYTWYLWQKFGRIGGFVMDLIRRPSVKQKKGETLPAFLKRVREDAEVRPEWYFMRLEYAMTEVEVIAWQNQFLEPLLCEVRLWQDGMENANKWLPGWPALPVYKNPNGLKIGQRKADMFEPITSGNFTGLRQGPWHGHPEQEE